ncbi:MAG: hypothetical protein H6697_11715 [Myxococcales bacterium]|nr:hypothetical protein [Myxococcales bacterium]
MPSLALVGIVAITGAAYFAMSDEPARDGRPSEITGSPAAKPPAATEATGVMVLETWQPDDAQGQASDDLVASGSARAEEVLALPEPEPVPHVNSERSTGRMRVPASYFEDKYAGASLEELIMAQLKVGKDTTKRQQAATEQRYADGLMEEEVVERAASFEEASAGAKSLPADGLIHSQRTLVSDDGGRLIVRRTTLPWEEYTNLYDLLDEQAWLGAEVKRRGNSEP